MIKPRRSRQLSPEERKLWAEVARTARPLPGRHHSELPEPAAVPRPTQPAGEDPIAPASNARAAKPALPSLAPLDRKTLVALRRGRRGVDSVIDLHGMRQADAHEALLAFLHRSGTAGRTLVLVITGKGAASSGESLFEGRGVLRRMVPHWLRMPELRSLVLGFEEALPHHGGAGALYVRLRRRRSPGSLP